MRLTFLGTGTSFGIPVIGCDCPVCTSTDPRDRRNRHAALLEHDDGGGTLLVDTPPELRLQLLAAGVRHIDAVWFTHCHADHIHGIDDLRIFSVRGGALPAYAPAACAETLRERFAYIFDRTYRPPEGTSRPEVELRALEPYQPVAAAGFELLPLPVEHGEMRPFGFRTDGLGYITDAKGIPPRTLEALRGVRVLVLNALWWGRPHPTHLNVEEAVDVAREVGAERTYLTHLTHRLRHAELAEALPEGVEPAWDGLQVEIS